MVGAGGVGMNQKPQTVWEELWEDAIAVIMEIKGNPKAIATGVIVFVFAFIALVIGFAWVGE